MGRSGKGGGKGRGNARACPLHIISGYANGRNGIQVVVVVCEYFSQNIGTWLHYTAFCSCLAEVNGIL